MTLIQENNETVITLKNNKIQKRYKEGKVPSKFLSPTWLKHIEVFVNILILFQKLQKYQKILFGWIYVEGITLNQWLEKNKII